MKKFAIICTLFFGLDVSVLLAQRPMPEMMGEPMRVSLSILSFANQPGASSDSVRVDLYFAMPYSSIEFLRSNGGYEADYSIALTVTESMTNIVAADRYVNYRIPERTADHTSRLEAHRTIADAEQISLPLRAGTPYKFHLTFHDQNAPHQIDTTVSFTTKDFRRDQPVLSDLMLYRSRHGQKIVPSIGSDVASLDGQDAGVFAELYDMPADSQFGVVMEVMPVVARKSNPGEEVLARATSTLRTSTDKAQPTHIFQNISFADLWTGHYLLRLFVLPNAADTSIARASVLRDRAIAMRELEVSVSSAHGIPLSTADLDEAIDQLRMIATGAEWDSLSTAHTTLEKRAAIVDFWHNRLPNRQEQTRWPDDENRPMKIFYARIAYANAHFNSGFQPGWKSDRGHVYVALGPPDAVDRHSNDINQKPYDVWQYSSPMNVRYYFVDSYMLGDYRLNGAFPPLGTFVWQ